jgi:hypothetical protein
MRDLLLKAAIEARTQANGQPLRGYMSPRAHYELMTEVEEPWTAYPPALDDDPKYIASFGGVRWFYDASLEPAKLRFEVDK